MKSFLVSSGLIVIYLCVVVYGAGLQPGSYALPTLDSACTTLTDRAGAASFRYVNNADTTIFAGEPNSLTSGLEISTTNSNIDKITFVNFNNNPMGFGTMDSTFSATYTFYISSRGANDVTTAPALQVFLDTREASGGPTDKTIIYEPYNTQDSSKTLTAVWQKQTFSWNSGPVWLRDTSSNRTLCRWADGTAGCDPPSYKDECFIPSPTYSTSRQCSAPRAGGPDLPPVSEYFNSNSIFPVGKIYGSTLTGARILGFGINLGTFNPSTNATITQISLTTNLGTYSLTFPKVASATATPCPAGPCDAPVAFNVSITPDRASLFNGSSLSKGTDLSAELKLAFNATAAQQSSNTNFKYQCLIDYRGDLLRYLGNNGGCYSVDFAVNDFSGTGPKGSSILCNFETPNVRFLSFNSSTGYAGSFRTTLRFNNIAGTVGTNVPLTAACTPIIDSTCSGTTPVTSATAQVALSAANTCQSSTGAPTDCSGSCSGDFTLESMSDVKLRVTDQGDVFMCPDPRAGGQLINVCNLLNTLQG